MPRRRTRGEAEIEARLENVDPGSDRYRILVATRDFKAAWVALGEQLTVAREGELYKEWGYPSFEGYCRSELRLKPETAAKLTRSYSFLRDHEPKVLKQREVRELPPLDVVDLLSRAKERANVSDRQLATIQEEVFADDATPTRAEVLKRFREVDPEAFKAPQKPVKAIGDQDVKKALLLAERLLSLIDGDEDMPRTAKDGLHAAVRELRRRFEATRAA